MQRRYSNFSTVFTICLLTVYGAMFASAQTPTPTPVKPVPKPLPAPITPRQPLKIQPVSFNNEVIPILTRYGCNQGACHGAQYGKGSFRLTLAGYDTDRDFDSIVKQGKGRRIALAKPEDSLMLRKASLQVPHGGGKRLERGTADYQTLTRWMREGAVGPNTTEPTIVGLEVYPKEKVMLQRGTSFQVQVKAKFSDGSLRDVTNHTRINSLNDAVASCTPEGKVSYVGKGQTAISARYSGYAAIALVMNPYNPPKPAPIAKASSKPEPPSVDALVARKHRQLGLEPSPLANDITFVRRVYFDLIGTPPRPEEIRAFVANKDSQKREKLVDALLARPEYTDYWTLKWGDLLRSNRTSLTPKGMWSFTNWIRAQFRENRPIDAFVRDIILAQGSTYTNGPANYYRISSNPQDLAETTSQVFLGVRLQCAKCHQHPFEKWSQKDYYQFAAFFARVGQKGSQDFGLFGAENVVRVNSGGEVYHPKNSQKMTPTPLGVTLASLPGKPAPDPDSGGDRRSMLADWLTSKENRFFARNVANRYWGYMFSKGIVNPIDDMRVTNPATNPELLEYLADELIKSNFNLKHLLRLIATSQTYQRDSEATPNNAKEEMFFTRYYPKQINGESILDAIDDATGIREKFNDLPLGTRAIQLPDPLVPNEFLDTFGRPQRLIACECERVSEPNLSQTLKLMNGSMVNYKLGHPNSRINQMINAKKSDKAILEEVYLLTLGRFPTAEETRIALGSLIFTPSADRKVFYEDLMHSLLNSKEFILNH